MAAHAAPSSLAGQRERRFFLLLALLVAAVIVTGFSWNIAVGRSSFDSPLWVHVHAVSFMSWLMLYITQNALVASGRIALHRRLGKIGAALAVWIVLVGLVTTVLSIAGGRGSPAFTPTEFLATDWTLSLMFGAMVAAALVKVRQTDWHRRLMLGAMLVVAGPGVARVLARSGLNPTAGLELQISLGSNLNVALMTGIFLAMAVAFDRWNRGNVHPAHYWGLAAVLSVPLIAELVGRIPSFTALANHIAA